MRRKKSKNKFFNVFSFARYFYLDVGGSCALLESRIYPVFDPDWSTGGTA